MITFEGQKPDEKVLLLGRKHPFVLGRLGGIILIFALIITGLFFKFGFSRLPSIASLLFLVLAGSAVARAWFNYKNSLFILTNQRVISVDQNGFFNRSISETPLDKIVNISHEVKGLMPTLFNYGALIIQNSGAGIEGSMIKLTNIPNPDALQRKIASAAKDYADTEVEIDLNKKER